MTSPRVCCACGIAEQSPASDPARKTELRPYGPGGAPICFPCAMKPENVATAERQFIAKFDAAIEGKEGVSVVALTKDGPKSVEGG